MRAHDFAADIAIFVLLLLLFLFIIVTLIQYTKFDFAFHDANVLHSSSSLGMCHGQKHATQTSDFFRTFLA